MTVSGSDSNQRVTTGRAIRRIHKTKKTVKQNASAPTPHSAAKRQALMTMSANRRTIPRTLDLLMHAVCENESETLFLMRYDALIRVRAEAGKWAAYGLAGLLGSQQQQLCLLSR